MKYVKMLGLAAIAAAALMAFVGASTASATVLCKNNSNTTTCSEPWGAVTVKAEQTKTIKLDTTFKTVECGKSTIEGPASAGSSTTTVSGPIEASKLTWGECNCTVNTIKGGTLEVHSVAGTDNGTLTSNGAEVTVSCSTIFGNVHCIYVTENDDMGTLVGGNPATFEGSVSVRRLPTSGLCSEEATWTPAYKVTAPAPLFVSAG